jgi:hypothetical protein
MDQGMLLIREEAKKTRLSGEVLVTLSFNDGGLVKAKKQITTPLLAGARPPAENKPYAPGGPDPIGKNYG